MRRLAGFRHRLRDGIKTLMEALRRRTAVSSSPWGLMLMRGKDRGD